MYQFPELYLSRACQMVGDWVLYMEPVKAGRKGYHAVAKVESITPDPRNSGMFLAIIDPNSYLPFDEDVPFQTGGDYPERSVLNEEGRVSGRAQAAVRTIPLADFNRMSRLASTRTMNCCRALDPSSGWLRLRRSRRRTRSSRIACRC